jgi:hypothetical protein
VSDIADLCIQRPESRHDVANLDTHFIGHKRRGLASGQARQDLEVLLG